MGQGQSGPVGKTGRDGENGKDGAPGKDGASDPDVITAKLIENNAFINNLGTNIAKNATQLSTNVATQMASDNTTRTQLVNSISTKQEVLDSIANIMTSNSTYKNRIQGPPGSLADAEVLKSSLQPKTLWCADGELCSIPSGKKMGDIIFGGEVKVPGGSMVANSDYEVFSNANKPLSNSDGWTLGVEVFWDPKIRGEKGIGHASSDKVNDQKSADRWITYEVPTGMKSANLIYLAWHDSRHFDVFGVLATGDEVFITRVNAFQPYQGSKAGYNDGVSSVQLSRVDRFTKITIRGVRGKMYMMGIGWNKQISSTSSSGFVSGESIRIGSWVLEEHSNGNLHIHKGDIEDWYAVVDTDKKVHARNTLTAFSGSRDVIGELNNLNSNTVLKTRKYQFRSDANNNSCLDAGSTAQNCDWNNGWKRFRLEDVPGNL